MLEQGYLPDWISTPSTLQTLISYLPLGRWVCKHADMDTWDSSASLLTFIVVLRDRRSQVDKDRRIRNETTPAMLFSSILS